MKVWPTMLQLNGYERTIFWYQDTKITDRQFAKLEKALAEDLPLDSCEIAGEIRERAEKQVNIGKVLKARRDDADDEDEYEDEYEDEEEYEDEYEDEEECEDDFEVESVTICDPGEQTRFQKHFTGRSVPAEATGEEHRKKYVVEYRDAETIDMTVTLTFDAAGTVTEVSLLTAEGLERSDFTCEAWEKCEPYFRYAEEKLEEQLS